MKTDPSARVTSWTPSARARTPVALAPPVDRSRGEGVEEEVAQCGTVHLGTAAVLAVLLIGVFEVDGRAAVEDAHGLAAGE